MLCDIDEQKANFVFRLKDKITRHNVCVCVCNDTRGRDIEMD